MNTTDVNVMQRFDELEQFNELEMQMQCNICELDKNIE